MVARTLVMFDLDGTLVDTNYLHVRAWQDAMVDAGHTIPAAWIHARIGMGGDQMLAELLGPGTHDDVKDRWRAHFHAARPQARRLPGATELLHAIASTGAQVAIASSSEQDDVDYLVSLLDADNAIGLVTTAADVVEAKPSPEVFSVALARAEVEPGHAVVIGDSVWDVQAAARAGVACGALRTGGTSRCALLDAGAAEVWTDPEEALATINTNLIGRLLR